MNSLKIKSYLENYGMKGDHEGFPLSAYYDFEIKEGELYCYLIDSAVDPSDKGYRFGFYCRVWHENNLYHVIIYNMRGRYKNVEIYRSRHAVAEMLEAEVG